METNTMNQIGSMIDSSSASCKANKPLKTNPFTTYRDPQTGKWIVVKPTAA